VVARKRLAGTGFGILGGDEHFIEDPIKINFFAGAGQHRAENSRASKISEDLSTEIKYRIYCRPILQDQTIRKHRIRWERPLKKALLILSYPVGPLFE